MDTKKGILLIATDNPYYGRMAYNLAVTLKAVENVSVAVITSGAGLSHLNDRRRDIFDRVIVLPDTMKGVSAKLLMFDYTPFERTLYIDADNIWLPQHKPSELFAILEGISFTAITEGRLNIDTGQDETNPEYTFWTDIKRMIEAYSLHGLLYQWRSEVVYFERNSRAADLFEKAKEIFRAPLVEVQEFAGGLPDEFAFNVAASMQQIEPHLYKWNPAFWYPMERTLPKTGQLFDKYFILSTGGKGFNPVIKKLYDSVVDEAHAKLRLESIFKLQPKKRTMTERRYL